MFRPPSVFWQPPVVFWPPIVFWQPPVVFRPPIVFWQPPICMSRTLNCVSATPNCVSGASCPMQPSPAFRKNKISFNSQLQVQRIIKLQQFSAPGDCILHLDRMPLLNCNAPVKDNGKKRTNQMNISRGQTNCCQMPTQFKYSVPIENW